MNAVSLSQAELHRLEGVAIDLVREAGALIVHERPAHLGVSATKSSDTDIVTLMDERSQELLARRVAERRPEDGFLGEEGGGAESRSGVTWVVDPIDGTVNYLYDLPAYAVSVAAVEGDPSTDGAWRPLVGAVLNPVSGELFHARRGGGAWRLRGGLPPRRLGLDDGPALAGALVGTGFGYAADVRRWQARVLLEVVPQVRDIRRMGSAALDLCHVADATLDAYYERGLNAWDLAAGWLVATEAGAVATGLGTDGPGRDHVVVARRATHPALVAALAAAVENANAADLANEADRGEGAGAATQSVE